MEQNRKLPMHLIAGGCFAALAVLFQIRTLISYGFTFSRLAFLVAYALLAAALFTEKKVPLLQAGAGIYLAMELFGFLGGLLDYFEFMFGWGMFFYCFFMILISVLSLAGAVVFAALCFAEMKPEYKDMIRPFWFIPAAICVVSFVLTLLVSVIFISYRFSFWNLLHLVLAVGALGATGLYLSYPDGLPADFFATFAVRTKEAVDTAAPRTTGAAATAAPRAAQPAPQAGDAYCGLVKHILLLLFTFGIWQCIWIYRTTAYLNRAPGEPRRTPSSQLLLCLFVPFYYIYWIYKSAQRLDKLSRACGEPSDLATLCLILAIFVGIVPPILMQDKINSLCSATATQAAPAQPVQPAQPRYTESAANNGPVNSAKPVPSMNQTDPDNAVNSMKAKPVVETPVEKAPVMDIPVPEAPAVPVVETPVAEAPVAPAAPAAPEPPAPAASVADVAAELKMFKELLDSGVISQSDYDAKKKQLLGL